MKPQFIISWFDATSDNKQAKESRPMFIHLKSISPPQRPLSFRKGYKDVCGGERVQH